jgi:nitrilase
MGKFKIAVCQLNSQTDKKENLAEASRMIAEAAGNGAELVCFPENVSYMGRGYRDQGEPVPGETSECFADAARTHDIWIVTGSFPETAEQRKPKNTKIYFWQLKII